MNTPFVMLTPKCFGSVSVFVSLKDRSFLCLLQLREKVANSCYLYCWLLRMKGVCVGDGL